ncbi:MAG: zf-HC2 domain-containing protein [Nitrospinae bacterium]|nr:zf-HC2 domain-containing protein [Nitrospinota bacterium]
MTDKMKCREIFEKISDYIDRDLDPDICGQIEAHIKGCEPCVAFINTLRRAVELYRKEGSPAQDIPRKVSANLREFLKKEIDAGVK